MSHVLLIEDDAWQADHARRQLERAGHKVTVARQAIEGIEAIDATRPDIIVLDLFLPGPNGMTLLHEIRSHGDLATLPVIVCSSGDVKQADLQAYGVVATLDKNTMPSDAIVVAVTKALL